MRLISASRSGQIVDHVKSGSQVKDGSQRESGESRSRVRIWVSGQKVGLRSELGLRSNGESFVKK